MAALRARDGAQARLGARQQGRRDLRSSAATNAVIQFRPEYQRTPGRRAGAQGAESLDRSPGAAWRTVRGRGRHRVHVCFAQRDVLFGGRPGDHEVPVRPPADRSTHERGGLLQGLEFSPDRWTPRVPEKWRDRGCTKFYCSFAESEAASLYGSGRPGPRNPNMEGGRGVPRPYRVTRTGQRRPVRTPRRNYVAVLRDPHHRCPERPPP